MLKRMYYDDFMNEYCLEKEINAPPERYLPTYRGDDIYIETYECDGLMLDIAYTELDLENHLVNRIRFSVAKEHNYPFATARMVKWVIPSKLFDKYVKDYGLETENNV